MEKSHLFLVLVLAATIVAGCDESASEILGFKPKPIMLPQPQTKPTQINYEILHNLFYRIINSDGYILADQYEFVENNLTTQLQIFSAVGPTTYPEQFPTDADKLAYWYNVRASWIIKMSMLHHRKRIFGKTTDYSRTISRMHNTPVPVDGKLMKQKDVDREIYKLGGFMAVVVAPGGTLDTATMPQAPFYAKDFPDIYRQRLNDFVNSTSRFVCNVETKQWYIPDAVWNERQKFIDIYQANSPTPEASFLTVLIWWVSGTAEFRLQNNLGYRCIRNPRTPTLAIISE